MPFSGPPSYGEDDHEEGGGSDQNYMGGVT